MRRREEVVERKERGEGQFELDERKERRGRTIVQRLVMFQLLVWDDTESFLTEWAQR